MASAPPGYERRIGASAAPDLAQGNPVAFGGGVGAGLQGLGESVHALSDTLREVRDNEQSLEAQRKAGDYATGLYKVQQEARQQYGSDTEAYAKAVADWKAANAPAIGEGVQNRFIRARIQAHVAAIDQDADRSDIAWTIAKRAKTSADNFAAWATTSNAQLDHASNYEELLQIKDREALAAHSTIDDLKGLSPDQKAAMYRDFHASQQTAFGLWLRRNDPKRVEELIKAGEFDALSPEERSQLASGASVEIRRREVEARAVQAQLAAQQREQESTLLEQSRAGVIVAPDAFHAAAKAAEARGDTSRAVELRGAGWGMEERIVFQNATPQQITAELAKIEGRKNWQASPEMVARHAALDDIRTKLRTAEPNFAPVNFDDPASIAARVQASGAWAQLHNGTRQLLTRDEADRLRAMTASGPGERSQAAELLARFPGGAALQAARQVAPGDYALQQAIDLPDAMRKELFQGEEARKHNQGLVKPQPVAEAWVAGAQGAMRFLPQEYQSRLLEGAKNIYAFRAARAGQVEFDEKLWNGVVSDMLQATGRGAIGKAGRQQIILPARMTQAEFDKRWANLPALPNALHRDTNKVIPLAELKSRYHPVTTQIDGVYWLQDDRGGFAAARDGTYAVLDMRRVAPARAPRVADRAPAALQMATPGAAPTSPNDPYLAMGRGLAAGAGGTVKP